MIYYNTSKCTYSAQDRQKFYNATKDEIIDTKDGTASASTYCDAIIKDS